MREIRKRKELSRGDPNRQKSALQNESLCTGGRLMSPPKLPLAEALLAWSDPELVRRLHELELYEMSYKGPEEALLHNEFCRVQDEMNEQLIQRLVRGEYRARGLLEGFLSSIGFVDIPPEQWHQLGIDNHYDMVRGDGLGYANVEIWQTEASIAAPPPVQFSNGELKIEEATFQLSGKQALFMKCLVEARASGVALRLNDVMMEIQSSSLKVDQLFKGNKNWPELKKHIQLRNGQVSLRA